MRVLPTGLLALCACASTALPDPSATPDLSTDSSMPDSHLEDLARADLAAADLTLIDTVMPTCTDRAQNGTESDVDCGGDRCMPCSHGLRCTANSDCTSRVCAAGTCRVAACTDGIKNGAETDVDCGGGACWPCAGGRSCSAASDCESKTCNGGTCTALPIVFLAHFDAPGASGVFVDELGHALEALNGAALANGGRFGGAGVFNRAGQNDQYLDTKAASVDFAFGVGDFTIDLWFNTTGKHTFQDGRRFVLRTLTLGVAIEVTNDDKMRLYMNEIEPMFAYNYTSGKTTVTMNDWHHVAVVRQGKVGRLYLDGREEVVLTNIVNQGTAPTGLRIGCYAPADDWFIGYVDEVRIVKGLALYTQPFTPPAQPFVYP